MPTSSKIGFLSAKTTFFPSFKFILLLPSFHGSILNLILSDCNEKSDSKQSSLNNSYIFLEI